MSLRLSFIVCISCYVCVCGVGIKRILEEVREASSSSSSNSVVNRIEASVPRGGALQQILQSTVNNDDREKLDRPLTHQLKKD